MNRFKKSAVATGLAAGLVAGGVAGAVLGAPGLSGAQEDRSPTTTVAPDTEKGTEDSDRAERWRERADDRLSDALAPLVEDGTIDQAQADAVVEQLLDSKELGRERHGHREIGGGIGSGAAAEVLGMTQDELREALRDGTTLAEVAEKQGIEVQKVIDALVAELSEHLDERVADGELTREQADERLAEGTDQITELVQEGGRPHRFRGHHGPGFHGPDEPAPPAGPED